jgi:branched-chain amino acid transport system substrate-binding protein
LIKKPRLVASIAGAALTVAALGTTVAIAPAFASGCSGAISVMAPITGPVAFIGTEQLHFAQLAVSDYNSAHGSSYTIHQDDTQLDASQASTVAPSIVASSDIVGVAGPAGSQEVLAIGGLMSNNNIALVSPSATRTSLTSGLLTSFFRPIPNDGLQGPGDATYMAKTLKAKSVFIIEEKTAYGTGLAKEVAKTLKKLKVKVIDVPVNEKNADYASIVTRVSKSTNFVFVTFQDAAKSQQVAQELKKQGKKALVFGSDGSDQPSFKTTGSYISAFAPDVTNLPVAAAVLAEYSKAGYGKWTTFGPPAYVAAQVIVEAAGRACAAGKSVSDIKAYRAATLDEVRKTKIAKTIMGSSLKFTANGDVAGGRFYIFRIAADGSHKLVG